MLAAKMTNKNPQNKFGYTPLHYSIVGGQTEAAKCLIPMLDDVTIENIFGETALHIAAKRGNIKLLPLLATKMTNKNPQNRHGETPFDYALDANQTEAAKWLMPFTNLPEVKETNKHLCQIM